MQMKKYLEKLQSKGIYTFTREELKNNLPVSEKHCKGFQKIHRRARFDRIKERIF